LPPEDVTCINAGNIAPPMKSRMVCPRSKASITARHLAILLVIVLPSSTAGQNVVVDYGEEFEPKTVVSPFAFYNESLAFGVGPVFVSNGFFQDQLSVIAGGFATTNGSYSLFLFGQDAQLPFGERLFIDWRLTLNHYDDFEQYRDGNPRYWNKRAGSNDSHEDDFIDGSGDDNFVRLTFKYLLPIGHGKDTVINTVKLDRGLLKEGAAGGAGFNPFKSGRSYIEAETWYRFQDIEADRREFNSKTNGVRLGLRYDNRDFAQNPTRGNETSMSVSRDFGSFDSSGNWTVLEGEFSQYFPLGATKNFRSIVLALNFWTAYSPTWADDHGQPPLFAGASLGGLDRMRGFPASRF